MKHETKKLYDAAYKIIIIIIIMIGGLSSFCDLKTKIREKPFRIYHKIASKKLVREIPNATAARSVFLICEH